MRQRLLWIFLTGLLIAVVVFMRPPQRRNARPAVERRFRSRLFTRSRSSLLSGPACSSCSAGVSCRR